MAEQATNVAAVYSEIGEVLARAEESGQLNEVTITNDGPAHCPVEVEATFETFVPADVKEYIGRERNVWLRSIMSLAGGGVNLEFNVEIERDD